MLMQPGRMNLLAALGVAVALGGCAEQAPDFAAYDFRLRHPVAVEAAMASLTLDAPVGGAAMAAEGLGRLDRFAADYSRRGDGGVDIAVAVSEPDDPAAIGFARTIIGELARRGIPSDKASVRFVSGQPKTALLTYRQYVARVPECGIYTTSSTFNAANAQSANFGCATERNIGLMVADPRDLERMRSPEDSDAVRSADVVAKYRRGEATTSAGKVESTTISGPK